MEQKKKPGRDKLAGREIGNLTNTLQGGREARNGRVRCKECGRQKKKLCKSGKASCENVFQKGNEYLGYIKYSQKPKSTYEEFEKLFVPFAFSFNPMILLSDRAHTICIFFVSGISLFCCACMVSDEQGNSPLFS